MWEMHGKIAKDYCRIFAKGYCRIITRAIRAKTYFKLSKQLILNDKRLILNYKSEAYFKLKKKLIFNYKNKAYFKL